jgi:cholera toxin transcriptional activator
MNTIGTKFILADRYTFDPNNNSLTDKENEEEIVRLGSNESRILLLLVTKPNDVIKRDELHDFVWRKQGFEVDDSSLTQAISTLRKALNDSTKQPEFVKTVPKLGYQMIAKVSPVAPIRSAASAPAHEIADIEETVVAEEGPHNVEPIETITDTGHHLSVQEREEPISLPKPHSGQFVERRANTSEKHKIWHKVMLLLAFATPLLVILSPIQSDTVFKVLENYHDIPISTTESNPELSLWLPSIKLCINKYQELRGVDDKPEQVIVTGGSDNRLMINFVHDKTSLNKNITLHIVSDPDNLLKVCQ